MGYRGLGSRVGLAVACAIVVALAFGCGLKEKKAPPDEKVSTNAAAVVVSVPVSSFVLYAERTAAVDNNANVTGGAVGVETVSNDVLVDGAELAVKNNAVAKVALYADAVLLVKSAVGEVHTNKLVEQANPTHGAVSPFDASVMPALPAAGAVAAGSGSYVVATNATVVLAPGAKGDVTVKPNGVLRLSGGLYQFASLTLQSNTRLEASAGSEVRIAGRLDAAPNSYFGPAQGSGLTAKGLRIEVDGQNGGPKATSQPAACAFGPNATLRALILVPGGTLDLGQNGSAQGALFGRAVHIEENTKLTFEDGFAGGPTCSGSCDDNNACTVDTCNNGTCAHAAVANGTSCNDNNACTQQDSCQAAVCVGASPVQCTAQDQCHAAGTCDPGTGTCSQPAKANGASCDDGNACTTTDSCQAGACVGTNPVVCAALDQCHAAGTCDPANGTCSNPAKPNGTSCDDGSACTQTDTCQAGTCTGSNPVMCTALDQCHVAGSCDPANGVCSNPPAADGITCTDGSACTQTDVCVSGTCSGANPVSCTALDQCHGAGTCNPASGVCSNPAKPNGTSCSDGNACTQTDSCQAGACVGSSPVTCTASDQCHNIGTCDPSSGTCSNPAKADGSSCSDGNACTKSDACQAGSCVGSNPVACAALDQCHDAGTCDTGTGVCSNPAKANGSTCDDGNACTQSDSCQAGTCTGASPVMCSASDQCHAAGTCDAATGQCSNPPKPNGAVCSDGNACTQSDACLAGTCTGANPVQCSPLNQCHDAGTCDPSSGTCSNPAKTDGASCSDGNACTQTDSCQAGACVGASPVQCSALDQCHDAGTCDPTNGTCSNPTKTDGASCSDGNACTQTDQCVAGMCTGSSPVVCSALDQCHDAGTCDPASGVCTNPAKADGATCSDGSACTTSDSCQAGACVGASPVVCAPKDTCHDAGTCDPGTGNCSNPAKTDGASCSDNLCLSGQTCTAGTCGGGTPVNVDDEIACTIDSCDPQAGVKHRACSALDRTVGTTLYESTKFLFTGNDPVQTDVSPGTIDALRITVLRGKVKTSAGDPLSGVTVHVVKETVSAPDFGQTQTAADGFFTMAANGGGELRVSYSKTGYLPAERKITAPLQDYVILPDVVMLAPDAAATIISSSAATTQVHRASVTSDSRGSRQATLIFLPGTTAELIFPNDSGQSVQQLTVRTTEHTVGPLGPDAMPLLLPPTSGYTYAIGLNADEAVAAGAKRVDFSQPVSLYLENFLGFPTGLAIPHGFSAKDSGCGSRSKTAASSRSWTCRAAPRCSTPTATAWPTTPPRSRRKGSIRSSS